MQLLSVKLVSQTHREQLPIENDITFSLTVISVAG